MNYRDSCTEGAFNVFRVEQTLNALSSGEGALEKVAQELGELRSALLAAPCDILVRVAGDVLALGDDALGPWRRSPFTGAAGFKPPPRGASSPIPALARELFAEDAFRPDTGAAGGCLISSTTEESNYWAMNCRAFTDPRS